MYRFALLMLWLWVTTASGRHISANVFPACDPTTAKRVLQKAENVCLPSLRKLCPENGKLVTADEWQQCYLDNSDHKSIPSNCRNLAQKALQCTNVVESWNKCTEVFKQDTLDICQADIKKFCSKDREWANKDKSVRVDINERAVHASKVFTCLSSKRSKLSSKCQNHLYSQEDRNDAKYFSNTRQLRLPGSKVMDASKWNLNKLQTCVLCNGLDRSGGVVDQMCATPRSRLCSRSNPNRPTCCDGKWSDCFTNESNRPASPAKGRDMCIDTMGSWTDTRGPGTGSVYLPGDRKFVGDRGERSRATKRDNCSLYKRIGYCTRHSWVRGRNSPCKRTCGLCKPTFEKPAPSKELIEWESCRSAVLSMKSCWKAGNVEEMHRRFEEYEEKQIALENQRALEAAERKRDSLRREEEKKRETQSKLDHKIKLQKAEQKMQTQLEADVAKAKAAADAKARKARRDAARRIKNAEEEADRRVGAAKKRESKAFAAQQKAQKEAKQAQLEQIAAEEAQKQAKIEALAANDAENRATKEAMRATAAKRKADLLHKNALQAQRRAHTAAQKKLAAEAAAAARKAAADAAEAERKAKAAIVRAEQRSRKAQSVASRATKARKVAEQQSAKAFKARREAERDSREARDAERKARTAQRNAQKQRQQATEQAARDVKAAELASKKAVAAAKKRSELAIQKAERNIASLKQAEKKATQAAERREKLARNFEKNARAAERKARNSESVAKRAAQVANQQATNARNLERKAKQDAARARQQKARAAEQARKAAIQAKRAADLAAKKSADQATEAAFRKAAAKAAKVARETARKAELAKIAADKAEKLARAEVAAVKAAENAAKLKKALAAEATKTARKLAQAALEDERKAREQRKSNERTMLKLTEAARKVQQAKEALRQKKEKAAIMVRTGMWTDSDCKRTAKELALARKIEAELQAKKNQLKKDRRDTEQKWAQERKEESLAAQREALWKAALEKKIARDRQLEKEANKTTRPTARPARPVQTVTVLKKCHHCSENNGTWRTRPNYASCKARCEGEGTPFFTWKENSKNCRCDRTCKSFRKYGRCDGTVYRISPKLLL